MPTPTLLPSRNRSNGQWLSPLRGRALHPTPPLPKGGEEALPFSPEGMRRDHSALSGEVPRGTARPAALSRRPSTTAFDGAIGPGKQECLPHDAKEKPTGSGPVGFLFSSLSHSRTWRLST